MKLSQKKSGSLLRLSVVFVVAILVALGMWLGRDQGRRAFESEPVGIMGTETSLIVIAPPQQRSTAAHALKMGEQELRRAESRLSTYMDDSQISQLNAAAVDEWMPLSPQSLRLLRTARGLTNRTGGAFDVTYRPVFKLWKKNADKGRLPGRKQLRAAIAASGWDNWKLLDDGVKKTHARAEVDLGGVAKGYAIDRAAEAMKRAGARAGLVNVGGDVRCFGAGPKQGRWPIHVRNPFRPDDDKYLLTVAVRDAAVCTSGNYYRYNEIDGRRYSHIIDPRTGKPTEAAPSVTVIAPEAITADAWATALSVLGPEGLQKTEPADEIQAMLVIGDPDDYKIVCTDGFKKAIKRCPEQVQIHIITSQESVTAGPETMGATKK